jgi:hypothetical protein
VIGSIEIPSVLYRFQRYGTDLPTAVLIHLCLGGHAGALWVGLVVARTARDSGTAGLAPRMHGIDLVHDSMAGLIGESLKGRLA